MKYLRSKSALWRSADGFLVLASISGERLEAHGSAHDVWEALVNPLDVDGIVDNLSLKYSGERAAMADDVSYILARLLEAGFVDYE